MAVIWGSLHPGKIAISNFTSSLSVYSMEQSASLYSRSQNCKRLQESAWKDPFQTDGFLYGQLVR